MVGYTIFICMDGMNIQFNSMTVDQALYKLRNTYETRGGYLQDDNGEMRDGSAQIATAVGLIHYVKFFSYIKGK